MRAFSHLSAICALAALLATGGGCVLVNKAEYEKLKSDRKLAVEETQKVKELNAGLQVELVAQRKQIDSLQALGGPERLKRLFHVRRIALGRYTGGVDLDGDEGDDGIKVYLRPIDADGSVIKAAGGVKIQLFDLAIEGKDNLIGRYEWTAEQISKQWSSGFMTYHFSFECPWKASPPAHDEITVRVEFTDYLTGKVLTAQKLCKVNLPAEQAPE